MTTSKLSAPSSQPQHPKTRLGADVRSSGGQHAVYVACLCAAVMIIILLATQWLDLSGSAAMDPSGLVDAFKSIDFEPVRMLRF